MLIIKVIAFKYSKKTRSFFDIIVNNFILWGILLQFFCAEQIEVPTMYQNYQLNKLILNNILT